MEVTVNLFAFQKVQQLSIHRITLFGILYRYLRAEREHGLYGRNTGFSHADDEYFFAFDVFQILVFHRISSLRVLQLSYRFAIRIASIQKISVIPQNK